MASVNKVILIGHLGQNPEGKDLNGTQLASFSVATTYKTKNGETTEWSNIKCFGRLAEIAIQYLRKGSAVYIEGRLSTSKWEKDGVKHSRTDIICERLQMLGGKADATAEAAPAHTAERPAAEPTASYDDIPF
jgi:single-strand DNA-binding protein